MGSTACGAAWGGGRGGGGARWPVPPRRRAPQPPRPLLRADEACTPPAPLSMLRPCGAGRARLHALRHRGEGQPAGVDEPRGRGGQAARRLLGGGPQRAGAAAAGRAAPPAVPRAPRLLPAAWRARAREACGLCLRAAELLCPPACLRCRARLWPLRTRSAASLGCSTTQRWCTGAPGGTAVPPRPSLLGPDASADGLAHAAPPPPSRAAVSAAPRRSAASCLTSPR